MDKDSLKIGGPDAAIWLDDELDRGFTNPCVTFDSPFLTTQKQFRCVGIEVFQISL